MLPLIIILSILGFFLVLYLVLSVILFNVIFKRKPCVPLKTLDLDKTQYKLVKDKVYTYSNLFEKLEYEDLTIKSKDNLTLHAHYYNNNSKKTIIFVHGYHATVENNFMIPGYELYNKGFNLLLIMNRASNDSEGKWITFGDKERFDLALWVEYINKNKHAEEITLYGVSMGASIVQEFLGINRLGNVKNAIMEASYSNTKRIIEYQIIKNALKMPFKNILKINMPMISLLAKMHGFSLDINPKLELMKNKNVRTLYFYGENDTFIPKGMSDENYNSDNTFDKRIFRTKANHAMSCYEDFDKTFKEIKDFLKIRG